jgi:hypothetical protein
VFDVVDVEHVEYLLLPVFQHDSELKALVQAWHLMEGRHRDSRMPDSVCDSPLMVRLRMRLDPTVPGLDCPGRSASL